MASSAVRLLTRSPYWPVLTHPRLRRILPGIGVSALGGGMSSLAISWLAIELAPPEHRALWVGAAITANTLPAALGALTLGRLLDGRRGAQLAGWDAGLRFMTLLLVPVLHAVGHLGIETFVMILAASSLLGAWGKAGRYTMLSEMLDKEQRLAGNALVNLMLEISTVFGPLLAALVIERGGPVPVIGLVALSWGILAASYRFAVPDERRQAAARTGASRAHGLRVVAQEPRLLGLILLSFGFFFFFGPASVALPLHVVDGLGASSSTLAGYYAAFGVGAVLGALLTAYLKRFPLVAATSVTVVAFGGALAVVGSGVPVVVSWVAFGLCGLFWGPFPSTTTVLFQDLTPPEHLPQVLAARGAAMSVATPLGAMLGAPLALLLGPQAVLLASGVCLALLGLVLLAVRPGERSPVDADETSASAA